MLGDDAPVRARREGAGDAGPDNRADPVADAATYAQLVNKVEEHQDCVCICGGRCDVSP